MNNLGPQASSKVLATGPRNPLPRASAQVVWIDNLNRGSAAKNDRKQL